MRSKNQINVFSNSLLSRLLAHCLLQKNYLFYLSDKLFSGYDNLHQKRIILPFPFKYANVCKIFSNKLNSYLIIANIKNLLLYV